MQWNSQEYNPHKLKRALSKIQKQKSKEAKINAEHIHNKVFKEIDCLQCANCCKSIPPIISNRDSKRISKALGISKSTFENKYIKIDEDGDRVLIDTPCPFLENDNKCRIYDIRPAACRQYPHSGDLSFFDNMSLHKRNAKYCPALYEIIKRLSEA